MVLDKLSHNVALVWRLLFRTGRMDDKVVKAPTTEPADFYGDVLTLTSWGKLSHSKRRNPRVAFTAQSRDWKHRIGKCSRIFRTAVT